MKPEFFSDLTPKQWVALPLVASGLTAVEVEKRTGISASTISDWLNNSIEFQMCLTDVRENVLSAVTHRLGESALLAVQELRQIILNGKSEAVRERACEFLITSILK